MGFWIFLFAMALPVPLLLVGLGVLLQKKPPQNINSLYGYRTARSKQNSDTWQFAQRYCGRLWVRVGAVLIVLTVGLFLLLLGKPMETVESVGTAASLFQVVVVIGTIFPVEHKLKKTFDANGQRIERSMDDE